MGLFGKKRVTAEEAGVLFVHDCLILARERWPLVHDDLRAVLGGHVDDVDEFLNENWTSFYFALAAIGCELQAARNLLPRDTGSRAVAAALATLGKNKDVGAIATNLVESVDEHWRESIEDGEMPSAAVPLVQALELDIARDILGQLMYDPLVMMAMDATVIRLLPGWWKQFLSKNTVA
jgi:hypothetical protein